MTYITLRQRRRAWELLRQHLTLQLEITAHDLHQAIQEGDDEAAEEYNEDGCRMIDMLEEIGAYRNMNPVEGPFRFSKPRRKSTEADDGDT